MSNLTDHITDVIRETQIISQPQNKQSALRSAEPIDLAGLVAYQDGAIVSKTLGDSKCGTITLFSFDLGQGLSEHTSPFNAFVQILEGNAEITVSGKHFQAKAGEIVILPSNQPHALCAVSKFKMLLTMIRASNSGP